MFLENVQVAATQVGILYIIVAVGVIADKLGVFSEATARKCTDLLFYIITPAVIIKSFLSIEFSAETGKSLLVAILCGFAIHVVGIGIVTPFFRKGDKDTNCIFKYGTVYGNAGYMALPLANAVLGDEGVFFCSAVVMAFNMFNFTHGIIVMSGETKFKPIKLLLNPGTLSVLIGAPLFLLSVNLPQMISAPIDYVASLNTPFAMLIFGTYLSHAQITSIFKDKRMYLVTLLKLFVLPAIIMLLLKLCGFTGTLLTAMTISASAPSANNTVMFAAKYNRDARLASNLVAAVSFISIITMPIMIAISQSL